MTKMCVAAANYIIEKTNLFNSHCNESNTILMTCKRLQKLLYFSDIRYMLEHEGRSMFNDKFYAWPSGPVIPSVYNKFLQYQSGQMSTIPCNDEELTEEMKSAIDFVFEKTKDLDTADLVKYSHILNGPWDSVYNDEDPDHTQVIEKCSIYAFYQNYRNNIFVS